MKSTFQVLLSTIKVKFGQILVYLIADISAIILTKNWRLETSSVLLQCINDNSTHWHTFGSSSSCSELENFEFLILLKLLQLN